MRRHECAEVWRHADMRSCDKCGVAIRIQITATNLRTWRRACHAIVTPTRTSRTRRARVRGEWRHAVAMSNVDTEPLPEHEKPLSIHERDCGLLCQCDAYSNVTGASARVCRGMASRRHEIRRRMRRRYQNTKNRYQSANVTLGA